MPLVIFLTFWAAFELDEVGAVDTPADVGTAEIEVSAAVLQKIQTETALACVKFCLRLTP